MTLVGVQPSALALIASDSSFRHGLLGRYRLVLHLHLVIMCLWTLVGHNRFKLFWSLESWCTCTSLTRNAPIQLKAPLNTFASNTQLCTTNQHLGQGQGHGVALYTLSLRWAILRWYPIYIESFYLQGSTFSLSTFGLSTLHPIILQ